MAQKSAPKGGKDNFTRYLVIGVVVAVVAIMVVPTVISKNRTVSQVIPATVSEDNGYAISFNTEDETLPVVDIYEDFQCPICQQFEGLKLLADWALEIFIDINNWKRLIFCIERDRIAII